MIWQQSSPHDLLGSFHAAKRERCSPIGRTMRIYQYINSVHTCRFVGEDLTLDGLKACYRFTRTQYVGSTCVGKIYLKFKMFSNGSTELNDVTDSYLLLEDGSVFLGKRFGADVSVDGEIGESMRKCEHVFCYESEPSEGTCILSLGATSSNRKALCMKIL